jgi:hypothetical protein
MTTFDPLKSFPDDPRDRDSHDVLGLLISTIMENAGPLTTCQADQNPWIFAINLANNGVTSKHPWIHRVNVRLSELELDGLLTNALLQQCLDSPYILTDPIQVRLVTVWMDKFCS